MRIANAVGMALLRSGVGVEQVCSELRILKIKGPKLSKIQMQGADVQLPRHLRMKCCSAQR